MHPRLPTRIPPFAPLALAALAPLPLAAGAAQLLAHWTFDESAPPYANQGPVPVNLEQDRATSAARPVAGLVGPAASLDWSAPGPATRLFAASPRLQTDSFGFSFWVRPARLEPFNTLLGKEKPGQPALQPWEKTAWQIQLGGDDGTGHAALEFVVRGRGSDFHGNVLSPVKFALGRPTDRWVHVAGGYDARTGALSLFVDGVAARSADPANAGADNSEGGALVVGTQKNGASVVGHGAPLALDELQIYDAPLSADEVAGLRANPLRTASARPSPALAARWKFDESTAPFSSAAPSSATLALDFATSAPGSEPSSLAGGRALVLRPAGGAPARLHTSAAAVQLDSFGFAFWLRSDALAAFDVLLTKEIPAYAIDPDYSRVAWRLQLGADADGDGAAPLELVVRGAARPGLPAPAPGAEPLHAAIVSTVQLPIGRSTGWIHVAGGYDHVTGAISLYVNGAGSASLQTPGAVSSDGSPLSVGAACNGPAVLAGSAARAVLDELQLYAGPLARADVALLANHPGRALPELAGLALQDIRPDAGSGGVTLAFASEDLVNYAVQGSLDLASWVDLATVLGASGSTSLAIPRQTLDETFGPGPRPKVFYRVASP